MDQSNNGQLDTFVEFYKETYENEVDLIIDDCSHDAVYTTETIKRFWPLLRYGGLYIVEDWQAMREFYEKSVELGHELKAVKTHLDKHMIVYVK